MEFFVGDKIEKPDFKATVITKAVNYYDGRITYEIEYDDGSKAMRSGDYLINHEWKKVEAKAMFSIGDTVRHRDHCIGMIYTVEEILPKFYKLKYKTNGTVYDTEKEFVETNMEKVVAPLQIKAGEKKKEEIPLDVKIGDWVTPINVSTGHTGIYEVVGTGRSNDTTTVYVRTGPDSMLCISNCRSLNQLQWKKVSAPQICPFKPICNGPVEKKAHFFKVGDFVCPVGESETILEITGISTEEYLTKNNMGQAHYYTQSTLERYFKLIDRPVEIAKLGSLEDDEPSSREDFEAEYAKSATKLAIKNNKVQKLLKKVDENKKELEALREGKWFGLYGRYDWKRIVWTLFFTLLSFLVPGYLVAVGFSWLVLGLTPTSLAVIATIIYTMRDKKLDAYIIGSDNGR